MTSDVALRNEVGIDRDNGEVDVEVESLAERGLEVAEDISQTEPFAYDRANLLMRNTVSLLNGVDAPALQKMDPDALQQVFDLSVATFSFLGDRVADQAREQLKAQSDAAGNVPAVEAQIMMMRLSGYTMLSATSIGPNAEFGCDPDKEGELRELVKGYAETFAVMSRALSTQGHPSITSETARHYYSSNITAAAGENFESVVQTDEHGEYI